MYYYASVDEREILVKSSVKLEIPYPDVPRCTSWMYRYLSIKYFFLFLLRIVPVKAKAFPKATKELAIAISNEAKEKSDVLKEKSRQIRDVIIDKKGGDDEK